MFDFIQMYQFDQFLSVQADLGVTVGSVPGPCSSAAHRKVLVSRRVESCAQTRPWALPVQPRILSKTPTKPRTSLVSKYVTAKKADGHLSLSELCSSCCGGFETLQVLPDVTQTQSEQVLSGKCWENDTKRPAEARLPQTLPLSKMPCLRHRWASVGGASGLCAGPAVGSQTWHLVLSWLPLHFLMFLLWYMGGGCFWWLNTFSVFFLINICVT